MAELRRGRGCAVPVVSMSKKEFDRLEVLMRGSVWPSACSGRLRDTQSEAAPGLSVAGGLKHGGAASLVSKQRRCQRKMFGVECYPLVLFLTHPPGLVGAASRGAGYADKRPTITQASGSSCGRLRPSEWRASPSSGLAQTNRFKRNGSATVLKAGYSLRRVGEPDVLRGLRNWPPWQR
jgi:hypothetical protein